ncbi:MAG: hypothetical protein ACTSWL_02045, partial [Promethearchaeota archaeon]
MGKKKSSSKISALNAKKSTAKKKKTPSKAKKSTTKKKKTTSNAKKSTTKKKKTTSKAKKSTTKKKKTTSKAKKSTTKKKKSISKKQPKLDESLAPNSEDLVEKLDENLKKLLTPEERVKMEENLELVEKYLKKIGIVDMNVDKEKLIVAVPFDYEEFTFLSHIVISTEWILIKTSIFEIENLSEMSILNLFSEVLKGNFILNSVVYALDPENKSIWAQADVPISGDFNTFKLS